ncbi:MAG: hypothetical protein WAZ27_02340 [Minisyncoccia bacterium]
MSKLKGRIVVFAWIIGSVVALDVVASNSSGVESMITEGKFGISANSQSAASAAAMPSVQNNVELWIDTPNVPFAPIAGKEAYYPDTDTNDDRVRDDYYEQIINTDNWQKLSAVSSKLVFGIHSLVLTDATFIGYSRSPLDPNKTAKLQAISTFMRDRNIQTAIATGGLRLTSGEPLSALPDCPLTQNLCLGEGVRTARVDTALFLRKWIDVGGKVDYISTDHAVEFAADAIANSTLGIKVKPTSTTPSAQLSDIIDELINYYSESYDLVLKEYERKGVQYPGPKMAIMIGASAFRTTLDNGQVFESPAKGSILHQVEFDTFLAILAQKLNQRANNTTDAAKKDIFRPQNVRIIFDTGVQNVAHDGTFEAWNFVRFIDNERAVQSRGFKMGIIPQPGSYAYSSNFVYSNTDVTCSTPSCPVTTPLQTLRLANNMSYSLQHRLLREYFSAGGNADLYVLSGWHRYPRPTGPSTELYSWFGKIHSFATYLKRTHFRIASQVRDTGTEGNAFTSMTKLSLSENGIPSSSKFDENRMSLLASASNDYKSVTLKTRPTGQNFSLNFQLNLVQAQTADWAAVQLSNSGSSRVWSNKGLSLLFYGNGRIALVDNKTTPIRQLAVSNQALTLGRNVDVEIEVVNGKLSVYTNNVRQINHTLGTETSRISGISFDAFKTDALFLNPTFYFYR